MTSIDANLLLYSSTGSHHLQIAILPSPSVRQNRGEAFGVGGVLDGAKFHSRL